MFSNTMNKNQTQPNIILLRHKFFSRNQGKHETIDEYVAELRLLSKDCEFDDLEEELVKDRLVCGVRGARVRGRLLRVEDLDLERAVRLCHAYEELRRVEQGVFARDRTGRRTSSGHGDQLRVAMVTDDAPATTRATTKTTDTTKAMDMLKGTDTSKATDPSNATDSSKATNTLNATGTTEYTVTTKPATQDIGLWDAYEEFRAIEEDVLNSDMATRLRKDGRPQVTIEKAASAKVSLAKTTAEESDSSSNTKVRTKAESTVMDHSAVPVRALQDYEGETDDELSFRRGDVFCRTNKHIRGWCYGECDGCEGFYPGIYTEVVYYTTEQISDYYTKYTIDPGELVRAVGDYIGAESNTLSFKKGDVFRKLMDLDNSGWSLGRKDRRLGVYPDRGAQYVTARTTTEPLRPGKRYITLRPQKRNTSTTASKHKNKDSCIIS